MWFFICYINEMSHLVLYLLYQWNLTFGIISVQKTPTTANHQGNFLKVKGELYAACVRSVMLYGSETWPIKVEGSQRLHCNEISMIRWMCGVTMRDRYPCAELRAWVSIKPIVDVMRQWRLRWFGHIERREDNSWLKKVQNLAVDGHSGRGRPRKTWEHVIMEDLCVKGLRR